MDPTDGGGPPGALHGLEVLELGHHVAASYCTKLLADLGAGVHKLEGPAGDPLRELAPLDPSGPTPTSGLFHYLNANKRGSRGDLRDTDIAAAVLELAAQVDVIVENFRPGVTESFGLGPDALLAANPRLVVVRISNYGQTGPWRDRAASNLTLQAETGMALRLGEPGGPVVSITGRLAELIGGTFAASAALAGVARADRCGTGSTVDVSLYEALLYSLSPVDVLEEHAQRHGIELSERQRVSPGFVPCKDGEVCISTLTAQNWVDLCLLIDRADWTDRMQEVQGDGPARTEFLESLATWTRPKSSLDVIATMQACRIAAATATDGRTMLEQPPFVARGFFVPQPGATFVRPAAPYRLGETPVTLRSAAPTLEGACLPARSDVLDPAPPATAGPPAEDDGRLPLAGLRVVDLTAFLAGGHLTESLAALGADVIKVESSRRPDGYRFVMTYPALGDHWWELSPLWQGQSLGKRSLSLDLGTDEGREVLAALLATADVLAENSTPRVIEAFGFDWERVRALNPGIVMVRMPAFGLEGPWRDHAGFAYNIEQVAGMAQNGFEGEPLVQPAGIVDVVNGQHALIATLAALRHRDRTGHGQLVEVAQVETVACLTADQVIEYQLTGSCRPRLGNRSRGCAPQGVYPAADGRLLAVTVATDDQWRRLGDELGVEACISELDLDERRARHDELDELVTAWTCRRSAAEAVDRLQRLGIAAGTLATLPEIRDNPQVVERAYYPVIEHPHAGPQRCARQVPLFSFGDLAIGPAPTLGQHNDEVLRGIGLDAERIAELRRQGVVAEGLVS